MGDRTRNEKLSEILKVLSHIEGPIGADKISVLMDEMGYSMDVNLVRYYLQVLDEKGFTVQEGRRGRKITEAGLTFLKGSFINKYYGSFLSKFDEMVYYADFDPVTETGRLATNIAFIDAENRENALSLLNSVCEKNLCFSTKFLVVEGGEKISTNMYVPEDKVAIIAPSSTNFASYLLRQGVVTNILGIGLLSYCDHKPDELSDIISIEGTTLSPIVPIVSGSLSSTTDLLSTGEGNYPAVIYSIPAVTLKTVKHAKECFQERAMCCAIEFGTTGKPICGFPIPPFFIGIIMPSGASPFSYLTEKGIEVRLNLLDAVVDYKKFENIQYWMDKKVSE